MFVCVYVPDAVAKAFIKQVIPETKHTKCKKMDGMEAVMLVCGRKQTGSDRAGPCALQGFITYLRAQFAAQK